MRIWRHFSFRYHLGQYTIQELSYLDKNALVSIWFRTVSMQMHLNLHNNTLLNVTPSLRSWNPRERTFSIRISLLVVTFPSHISRVLTLMKQPIKEFKPHACTHHIVITIIIAMSTLCYSIMPHTTLILYYHASMLTLHTSFISRALWLPHVWYQGGESVIPQILKNSLTLTYLAKHQCVD